MRVGVPPAAYGELQEVLVFGHHATNRQSRPVQLPSALCGAISAAVCVVRIVVSVRHCIRCRRGAVSIVEFRRGLSIGAVEQVPVYVRADGNPGMAGPRAHHFEGNAAE